MGSLTLAERETTVTATEADEWVEIHTFQRRYMGALLRKLPNSNMLVAKHEPGEYLHVRLPAHEWNPATGVKRKGKPLTPERRAELAEQLAKGRNKA